MSSSSPCLSVREAVIGILALTIGAALVMTVNGSFGPSLALMLPATPALPVVEYKHGAFQPIALSDGAPPLAGAPNPAAPALSVTAPSPLPASFLRLYAAVDTAAEARWLSPPPPPLPAADTPDLTGCAFVSMATADESARLALVMFQTLRDVGTRAPHLVLILMRGGFGSRHCSDAAWMLSKGRLGVGCGAPDAGPAEIVSEEYLARFEALGVELLVMDQIPKTPYTEGIAGGSQWFWGAAFNKLRVFSLTQFRKVVWLDSDDFFLRNVDHLFALPPLTGSVVTACCNFNGPAYPGGGIWVLEPSTALFEQILGVIAKPRPGTNEGWLIGDMQVIRVMFGAPPPEGAPEPLYPAVNDRRHGYVSGLRYYAPHRDKSAAEFDAWIDGVLDGSKQRVEGYDTKLARPGEVHWKMLDMRYDQCVGSFKCSPERDDASVAFSVHFSCLQTTLKPPGYKSESDLFDALRLGADGPTRKWFLRWYAVYVRAMGGVGFPEPAYSGEPVPGENAELDEKIEVQRLAGGQL